MAFNKDDQVSLTYEDAGVSVETGNLLVSHIKPSVKATKRKGSIGSFGGFAGMFDLRAAGFIDPILLAGTDGVGTKVFIAQELQDLSMIGQDLVAMCVNDLLVHGGEPLFFLDYYACSRLIEHEACLVVQSIAKACQLTGCELLGGETAEMPGLYKQGDFDLAGFAVGAVERDQVLCKANVCPGNRLIGLASNGLHSNGFSLARAVIKQVGCSLQERLSFSTQTLGEILLEPTILYTQSMQHMIKLGGVKAGAHITGGGMGENLVRSLPDGCNARITNNSWYRPPIFDWLQEQGNINEDEMRRTFNCGIGMIVIVDENIVEQQLSMLKQHNIKAWDIGLIENSKTNHPKVMFA